MKPLVDQSHYEILDVPHDAESGTIERAFHILRTAFAADSVATYSLFAANEAGAIRERVEEAYEVLTDAATREEYDQELESANESRRDAIHSEEDMEHHEDLEVAPVLAGESLSNYEMVPGDTGEPLDGSQLRRWRLQRGVEIEEIAEATKVNPLYLKFIEEERFEDMPAGVYVRGFLVAYANYLDLNPEQVVPDFMERFERACALSLKGGRRWLRGRRD